MNGTWHKHFSTTDIRKRIIFFFKLSGTEDCMVKCILAISAEMHAWVWYPCGGSPAGLISHRENGHSGPGTVGSRGEKKRRRSCFQTLGAGTALQVEAGC